MGHAQARSSLFERRHRTPDGRSRGAARSDSNSYPVLHDVLPPETKLYSHFIPPRNRCRQRIADLFSSASGSPKTFMSLFGGQKLLLVTLRGSSGGTVQSPDARNSMV